MTFVAALRASPGLEILAHTARHAEVAAEVISEVFHRFPFIEVLDPLTAP